MLRVRFTTFFSSLLLNRFPGRIHFGLELRHGLVELLLGVRRQAQDSAADALGRDGPAKALPARIGGLGGRGGGSVVEHPAQLGLDGGGEDGDAGEDADDSVEIDAGPDEDGPREGEDQEGGGGEGEGELGDEEGEQVVVALGGEGRLREGIKEEGAEVSPEV